MPITVMNNSAAATALGELNKNNNQLDKDLKKISTGQAIAGAGDGASDYAISEKMRAKIRGLSQDVENVQNGRALLKIAMGGVDDIVSELRCLKELALNSCNDHNTDVDRGILQKEFNARKAHIDNVAFDTNYNGIKLLDGRWAKYKKTSGAKEKKTEVVSETTKTLSEQKTNSQTTTQTPVTSIKTITSPKQIVTDEKVETLTTNPGESTVTVGPNTTATTTSETKTEGPTTGTISSNKTVNSETTTEEGDTKTVVRNETFTSTKATTTTQIVTDTTTTTSVTKTTMISVREITDTIPGEIKIITNGMTSITEDGLYEFAPDFTGTLSVSAKKAQLNGPSNGAALKEVYIKDTGVDDLYIKNLNIINTKDESTIAFDSNSSNTLHALGNISITYQQVPQVVEKAAINAGGGLSIVGGGSLLFRSNLTTFTAAMIGSDTAKTCGNIDIGQQVEIKILKTASDQAVGIGSGADGACGDINIGTNAYVEIINQSSQAACIGSGYNGKCGDITVYSNANIKASTMCGAGIGTSGHCKSVCGDITIYSDTTLLIGTKYGACIGSGDGIPNDPNNYLGTITVYSYPNPNLTLSSTSAASVGKGAGVTLAPQRVNTLSQYNRTEGCILDLSELSLSGSSDTKYEVTTTTITTTEVVKNISETKTTTVETYDDETQTETTTIYRTFVEEEPAQKLGDPLIIHTGTRANQNLPIYIEDMRLDALKIKDTLIDPLENAKKSLDIIDGAINYALDQATTLGAYHNELEFTESNLVSSNENTTSAESVIRDADMAKEMLNYTKRNVLAQAAQSMLAQANTNMGNVMSLLQ